MQLGVFGVNQQQAAEVGNLPRGALEPSGVQRRELWHPESTRKHLKPSAPAACRPGRSASLPGTAPPQNPTSTWTFPPVAARLSLSAAACVVGGRQFSGMSTIVVMPPAAAASVAVANPSQSVRPGSLTCTCESTRPGSSTSSPARSNTGTPGNRVAAS